MAEYPLSDVTERIIGAAIEVHRSLGPGLLESAYEACLATELRERGLFVEEQVIVPVVYKGRPIEVAYRIDLLVEKSVVVELKSVDEVTPIHEAQLITYLKLASKKVGLLINFNVELLKNGVTRRIV